MLRPGTIALALMGNLCTQGGLYRYKRHLILKYNTRGLPLANIIIKHRVNSENSVAKKTTTPIACSKSDEFTQRQGRLCAEIDKEGFGDRAGSW